MPYSFIEIEQSKNRKIWAIFIFLIAIYFATTFFIVFLVKNFSIIQTEQSMAEYTLATLTLSEILIMLLSAAILGFLHWLISTYDLIPRILRIVHAQSLNDEDTYHKMLKNIIDEVSVATGGKKIQGVVIPTSAMNAFALADFRGNAVIGVTEGLLARLNRAQIEAVVGHEAAHIISGDCLSTTLTSSLFALYSSLLSGMSRIFQGRRGYSSRGSGGGLLILALIYFVLSFTKFLSLLGNMFISRQREFKADAIAVRLTRDPLSLAQALYSIAYRWRGSGLSGEEFEAIFIVNPNFTRRDEQDNLWAELFSTHPPLEQRLKILLDMAHSDVQSLENNFLGTRLKPKQEVPQLPQAVDKTQSSAVLPESAFAQWLVNKQGQWLGPFPLDQLKTLTWFGPDSWIKKEGGPVALAFEDGQINEMFAKRINQEGVALNILSCPRCRLPLSQISYEGLTLHKCSYCAGVLTHEDKVQRIIIREQMQFSEKIHRLADTIKNDQENFLQHKIDLKGASLYPCPYCQNPKPRMLKMFYTMAYPVEIDKCNFCGYIWFDQDELEVLQCLIEEVNQDKYK